MKKFLILVAISLFACSTVEKKADKPKKEIKKQETVKKMDTGWINPDTYIVKSEGQNEREAVSAAQKQILKKIVKLRFKKYGIYYQISKIQLEFEDPLKTGEIIYQKKVGDKLIIYYRIKGKNLRKKFEKK